MVDEYYNRTNSSDEVTSEKIEQNYKKIIFSSENISYEIKEDIVNDQGVLIARLGYPVTKSAYSKIVQHKLSKKIDEYLVFSDQVSMESLLDQMASLCSPILSGMKYDFDDTMKTIQKIIHLVKFDSGMLNKLTVFRSGNQEKLNQALSSTFTATEIGKSLRFTDQLLVDLFCACLLRDVGQLFVNHPNSSTIELTQEEYKAIKVHPVISHLILKESNTHFSDQVMQAVLNHHERIDASGYPRKLHGKQVGLFERIIAVVDTFEAMKNKDRSVEDAMWVLKCNSAKQSIAGDKIQAPYDADIVFQLERLINKDIVTVYDDCKRDALARHVKILFTSISTISSELEKVLLYIDDYLERGASPNTNNTDSDIRSTYSELHKLKYSILHRSGLNDLSIDRLPTTPNDLNETRKDIERIAPSILSQLNVALTSSNKLSNSDLSGIGKQTSEIHDKVHNLCRILQQPIM